MSDFVVIYLPWPEDNWGAAMNKAIENNELDRICETIVQEFGPLHGNEKELVRIDHYFGDLEDAFRRAQIFLQGTSRQCHFVIVTDFYGMTMERWQRLLFDNAGMSITIRGISRP